MRKATRGGVTLAAALWVTPASAQEPLLPRSWSASRDATGVELAYGPRAQLSLGAEPGLLGWGSAAGRWRLGATVVLATENASSRRPLVADETGRVVLGLVVARGFVAPWSLDAIEVSAGAGVERTWQTGESKLEAPHPWDLPFGAGGVHTSVDLAWRLHRGPLWLDLRLATRVYLPGWALAVGARTAADTLGGYLGTGIAAAPSFGLTARWQRDGVEPVLALFGEQFAPLDDAARPAYFFRAMAGPRAGRLWGFLSLDAGNGKGALTIRREARLSLGVRVAAL